MNKPFIIGIIAVVLVLTAIVVSHRSGSPAAMPTAATAPVPPASPATSSSTGQVVPPPAPAAPLTQVQIDQKASTSASTSKR